MFEFLITVSTIIFVFHLSHVYNQIKMCPHGTSSTLLLSKQNVIPLPSNTAVHTIFTLLSPTSHITILLSITEAMYASFVG